MERELRGKVLPFSSKREEEKNAVTSTPSKLTGPHAGQLGKRALFDRGIEQRRKDEKEKTLVPFAGSLAW